MSSYNNNNNSNNSINNNNININGYNNNNKQILTISVDQAKLTYGSSQLKSKFIKKSKPAPILNGLSLQIPEGSIYGLLGPSGCGKTTLIRCILGMIPIQSGEIRVLDQRPTTKHSVIPGPAIGYMPQDITLYNDLTIVETLWYFGSLTGMNEDQIKERTQFLIVLLNLHYNKQKTVGQLSGGQKRRVSFATALIHNPLLLILDEPTVGVDPLLCKSIWEHLIKLSTDEHRTILITTHYIEEARRANYVGMMRDGRILEQGNPKVLIEQYQMATLEDVFLYLCAKAETQRHQQQQLQHQPHSSSLSLPQRLTESFRVITNIEEFSTIEKNNKKCKEKRKEVQFRTNFSKKFNHKKLRKISIRNQKGLEYNKVNAIIQIGTIIQKNVRSLSRSPGYVLFQFFLPMLQSILFCAGKDLHGIPVAIYDGDNKNDTNLSSAFLDSLSTRAITKYYFNSAEDAIQSVMDGKQNTAMLIPENFSQCYLQRMLMSLINNNSNIFNNINNSEVEKNMFKHEYDDILNNSTIILRPDLSNQVLAQFVQSETLRAFNVAMKNFFQQFQSVNFENLTSVTIQTAKPVYGNLNSQFTDFKVSGILVSLSFFSALSLTSTSLVVERINGLIERTVIVGVGHFQIIFAHILTNITFLVVQVILIMLVVFAIFDFDYNGSLLLIGLLAISQSMSGMCYGLFVSAIADTENIATMLSLGAFFPSFLMSGSNWPIEAMADGLRYISYIMPATVPTQSMRYIVIRGWDISYWQVYIGFIVTGAWIFIFITISTFTIKYKKR